ncbi:MAG: endopeptidase La [Myxococcales bacterium]|nr:endopeptidase La [Myxococcales bacterium]
MSTQTHYPESFALLPLRRGVLLPGTTMSVPVGRRRSVALVESLSKGDVIGVVIQRDPSTDEPVLADVHGVGTYARVERIARSRDGRNYRLVLEGLDRFELREIEQSDPYWYGRGDPTPDGDGGVEAEVLADEIRSHLRKVAGGNESVSEIVESSREPGRLADRLVSALEVDRDREIQVLLTLDVPARLRLTATIVAEAKARWELQQKIGSEVRRELEKDQRKHLLRQQLRAIQKELGEGTEGEDALAKLEQRLDEAELGEEAREVVERELGRLRATGGQGPESNVIRTYLEWIADMPWNARAELQGDIDAVAAKLDEDHYGLEKVKRAILEHLAVLRLSGKNKGSILCLAGPPGVGKTSLGQSIADATGRPFIRVSLGGVRDESEIRGHRRTYVGALPGRLVNALRKVKVKNPVILLDEVDKLGQGFMGSPEAALLEVLDPEQNKTFTDHYLELPFDLSEVLFIATANSLEPLSAPLRDRMEIITLSGYTPQEKRQIARGHLIPKQLSEHALEEDALQIDDEILDTIIRDYTREAGVRQLGRELTKLSRTLALRTVRTAGKQPPRLKVDLDVLRESLGKPRFFNEVAERSSVPGVATGLAYTPVGGDILFIETSRMKGKGGLQITGQLGEVMQESAKAALSYLRSQADRLGIDVTQLESHDVHIHVPAGGVPKDGPSAGVTMFTALASLLSGRRVRSDTAMTGECSLRGRVLPVGGIKEKVMAAHRAGIERVILPALNQRDVDDIPEDTRAALELIFVEDMMDALDAALEPAPGSSTSAGAGPAALSGTWSSGTAA